MQRESQVIYSAVEYATHDEKSLHTDEKAFNKNVQWCFFECLFHRENPVFCDDSSSVVDCLCGFVFV